MASSNPNFLVFFRESEGGCHFQWRISGNRDVPNFYNRYDKNTADKTILKCQRAFSSPIQSLQNIYGASKTNAFLSGRSQGSDLDPK